MAPVRLTYERPAAPGKRITALTPGQEQAVTEWRDRWMQVGTDTAPADRATAEAAIKAMCARVGVECPPIVWCDGPLTMALTYMLLRRIQRSSDALGVSLDDSLVDSLRDSLGRSLRDSLGRSLDVSLRVSLGRSLGVSLGVSLGDALGRSLGRSLDDSLGRSLDVSLDDSLRDSLDDSLDDSLHDSLGVSLRDSLRVSLGDSLHDSLDDSLVRSLRVSLGVSLDDSLHDSLGVSLRDSLRVSLGDSLDGEDLDAAREMVRWWRWYLGGQHSLAWWAHYAYCRDELGVDYGEQQNADLNLWLDLSRSCGWWRPRDGIIWVCERPAVQTLDQDGRLHNASGLAILCRDSYAVWAIHGVRVTRQVVEAPGTLTVEQILGEQNAEVRRVMIDRFGAGRLLAEADACLVDEDPEWGKLWRLDLDGDPDEPLVMVECVNSTAEPDGSFKTYWLRVPPSTRTVVEALAWTFDVPEQDYALLEQQT